MFKMTFSQIFTSVDKDLARFGKTDKYFARELDLKDIKVPVKVRDVHKVEIKNYVSISVFGYENREKLPIQSKVQKILLRDMLIYY